MAVFINVICGLVRIVMNLFWLSMNIHRRSISSPSLVNFADLSWMPRHDLMG
jgi:hypothetical protein